MAHRPKHQSTWRQRVTARRGWRTVRRRPADVAKLVSRRVVAIAAGLGLIVAVLTVGHVSQARVEGEGVLAAAGPSCQEPADDSDQSDDGGGDQSDDGGDDQSDDGGDDQSDDGGDDGSDDGGNGGTADLAVHVEEDADGNVHHHYYRAQPAAAVAADECDGSEDTAEGDGADAADDAQGSGEADGSDAGGDQDAGEQGGQKGDGSAESTSKEAGSGYRSGGGAESYPKDGSEGGDADAGDDSGGDADAGDSAGDDAGDDAGDSGGDADAGDDAGDDDIGLDVLARDCSGSSLAPHTGFQEGSRCVDTEFGEVPDEDKAATLLITSAPASVGAKETFTIEVSTRNLVRDRFLPAAAGGYYLETSLLNDEGLVRGHFHTACRLLSSNEAPEPAPAPAFFAAVEDGGGGSEPDRVNVEIPGLDDPGTYQCAVWAGDGSHRVPMAPRANQIPAFDSIRITVD